MFGDVCVEHTGQHVISATDIVVVVVVVVVVVAAAAAASLSSSDAVVVVVVAAAAAASAAIAVAVALSLGVQPQMVIHTPKRAWMWSMRWAYSRRRRRRHLWKERWCGDGGHTRDWLDDRHKSEVRNAMIPRDSPHKEDVVLCKIPCSSFLLLLLLPSFLLAPFLRASKSRCWVMRRRWRRWRRS